MAIGTKTSAVSANYTVEISYGTAQEVADRIATLSVSRQFNINIWVLGFTIDSQGVYSVLLKYMTTPD